MKNQPRKTAILKRVVEKETPTAKRRKEILKFADKVKRKVEEVARKQNIRIEVTIEGSVEKDTWLQSEADIDIFLLAPENVDRKTLETAYLKTARKALTELELHPIERFSEHPYVEAFTKRKIKLDLVPCFKVIPPKWKSATDRTPHHTEYVKTHLKPEQKSETRILKRFLKGIGVYGADIKTRGFSGYLTELLILAYGNFTDTLENASKWTVQEKVDIEGYHEIVKKDIESLFDSPLIFIDPVDKYRNVAAAVARNSFDIFRTASKVFLEKPNINYFYPKKTTPYKPEYLSKLISGKHAHYIFLKINNVQGPPDIIWGQLYKTEKAINHLLKNAEFRVLRSKCWSDEKRYCVLIFELDNVTISNVKKHYGPPIISDQELSFTSKYLTENQTVGTVGKF